jgi:hypothetical protein
VRPLHVPLTTDEHAVRMCATTTASADSWRELGSHKVRREKCTDTWIYNESHWHEYRMSQWFTCKLRFAVNWHGSGHKDSNLSSSIITM